MTKVGPRDSFVLPARSRREVARIDPQLPVYRVRPMQALIDDALVGRRVPMLIAVSVPALRASRIEPSVVLGK